MAVPMIQALVGVATDTPYKATPRILNANPTYQVLCCRDGKWIQLLGLETSRHLGKLLVSLGIDGAIKADARFAPVGENYSNLITKVVTDVGTRIAFNSAIDAAVAQKDVSE